MVLAIVVLLYVVATAAGVRRGSGSVDVGDPRGLPQALGRVLVLPAGSGDVLGSSCRQGNALSVPLGQECSYRLRTGFLGKRLRLRLAGGGPLAVLLVQPKPKVMDTETLDAGHPSLDLVYHQEGSTLALTCQPSKGPPCEARIG